MVNEQEVQLSNKNKKLRIASIFFNWFWCSLLLPIIVVCIILGTQLVTSTTDRNKIAEIFVACLYWQLPFIIMASVIVSFLSRTKLKYFRAFFVQLIPLIYILLFLLIPTLLAIRLR